MPMQVLNTHTLTVAIVLLSTLFSLLPQPRNDKRKPHFFQRPTSNITPLDYYEWYNSLPPPPKPPGRYSLAMGFLFHIIRLPTALTGGPFILNLWTHLKLLAMGALAHLGIYKPPPDHQHHSADDSNNYIFIFDEGTCPSLVPIPVHVVAAAIKTKVPVLQFQDFLLLQQVREPEAEEETESSASSSPSPSPSPSPDGDRKGGDDIVPQKMCTICLDPVDLKHQVRQLSRCTHVFHRDCLDTWVDSGQVTCPLCRSLLLPPKTNLTRCALAAPAAAPAGDPPPSPLQDNAP